MSSLLQRRILTAASFRLTLVYAAIFVVATLAVLFVGGMLVMLVLRAEVEDDLESEVEELQVVFDEGGLDSIIETIEARSRETYDSGLWYRLSTTEGEVLAGNLALTDFPAGEFEFIPPGEEDDELHIGQALLLTDEVWLVVSIDLEPVLDTWELMLAGTGWTLGISLPLALVCGGMMSAMVLRRIEAISATTQRIRDGGLNTRVPLRGTDDEFDRLSFHINAMLDSIEGLTRNIQEVSTGIAHDLRTPLTRVYNRLEALKSDKPDPDRLPEVVDRAKDEVASLLKTFDALLRIGQIEAGTRRAGFRNLDLSALVGEVAETYEVTAAAHGKTLKVDIADGLGTQGDGALLIQMIANVLENAIEHTPADTEISMKLSKQHGAAKVTIADNGPGVPEHERTQVFERFYRLDRSRNTNGNGLGLSIVRSIANLHGIDVRTGDNHPGFRVEFCFPV